MTSARRRVQATSYTSAAKPEIAAAVLASTGAGEGEDVNRGDRWNPRDRFLPFGLLATPTLARSSGERRRPISADPGVRVSVDSQSAPAAAAMFSPTPTKVVPRRPSVGISQNPAQSAPSAAPAVFAAYKEPGLAALDRGSRPWVWARGPGAADGEGA